MPDRIHRQPVVPAILAILLLSGCGESETRQVDPPPTGGAAPAVGAPAMAADYTGSASCGDCHPAEFAAWQNSHHDLALQVADDTTVLADFTGTHAGAAFRQADGRFQIIPGAGEAPRDVAYTFGVAPLQQYVVPAELGALQTFPIAWDSRPASAGGQRWFNLNDDVYASGDPMHWAGRANRWNSQCADCHSTAVEKHYDARTRTYSTVYAVEDVGCEACHGPGSLHADSPTTHRLSALASQATQINACAPCHSRRAQLAEGFRPSESFFDYYTPRLLTDDLYHVDGQIDDEVYVYGSFLQSRMHAAGVTCSNCHEPHSATLKRTGNATCTYCHQGTPAMEFAAQSAGSFDTPEHHLHEPDSPGARCVSCHMPSRIYMGVDARRDHSFRIPRPDLAATLGVPDACSSCHQDRSAEWASEVIRSRFGDDRPAHFATAFAAAAAADPGADAALAALVADASQPSMVRASALARLSGYRRGYTLDSVRLASRAEPLLRMAAPLAASSLTADARWRLLAPLLEDELRAVRHQALTALLPTMGQDPDYQARLAPHVDEWLSDQQLNLDYPEVLTNVAGAQLALGNPAAAEASLTEALHLQANWVPGLMNLSDLYRATGRDPQAGGLLQAALELAPEQPEVVYGYALWLSRQGQLAESMPYFEQAALLAPDQVQFSYAWAIALNDSGDGIKALSVLEKVLARWPEDPQLLLAAITMLRDQGRFEETLPLLDRLLLLRPGDQQLRQFREAMARAASAA